MSEESAPFIHPTAVVEDDVTLHAGVRIWHFAHVRMNSILNKNVSIGKSVFIDCAVSIGSESRIQNGANIYQGVVIGSYCFVGPSVTFTNDRFPRIGRKDWNLEKTTIADGATLGAGVVVRCGVTVHSFAMVGAAAFVTKDIPAFTLVTGVPAVPVKYICACGSTTTGYTEEAKASFRFVDSCCEQALVPEALSCAEAALSKW